MQVKTKQILLDYKRDRLLDEKNNPITLHYVMITALIAALPADRDSSLDSKLQRDALASRLHMMKDSPHVELTAEEIALVKARVNATFHSAVLVAAAVRALESGPDGVPEPQSCPTAEA